VPVPVVLGMQMSVVRVVDVVAVRYRRVAAVGAVGVLVNGVLLMEDGHGAHLRGRCRTYPLRLVGNAAKPRACDPPAMKAITYRTYGGPDVLEYGEVRDPKVGPDCVLIKVRAASVNPVDWKCREGYLDAVLEPVFPVIPGWDVSGVVVRPGAA